MHNFLQANGVEHEIVLVDGDPRDLDEAAALCDLPAGRLTRTHLFEVDGSPVMVLIPGGRSIDGRKVAKALGAADARPVPQQEVHRLTGFVPGAVPPVATQTDLPLLVDAACTEGASDDCLYTSAGDRGAILKVRLNDLLSLRREGRVIAFGD